MERNGFHQAAGVGRGLGRWLGGPPGLALHVGLFLLGATFLILLNLLRSPQELWFWRPMAWWSGLLLLHGAFTVGGAVRRAEAAAPTPEPVRPSPPEPRLAPALRTAVARTVTTASGLVAGAVAVVERARADRAGNERRPAAVAPSRFGATPSGWSGDDDAAFASWLRSTDGWGAIQAEDPAPVPEANGRYHRSDVLAGAARTDHGAPGESDAPDVTGHRPPTATGRFRANGGVEARSASASANGHASSEWVLPPDVEAMWARPAEAEAHPRRSAAGPGTSAWASPASAGMGSDAVARGASGPGTAVDRRGEPSADVVLDGSVPVDPNDPAWTRLEAAAAAWLARRDARSALTPLPAPPPPTGTEGASSTMG